MYYRNIYLMELYSMHLVLSAPFNRFNNGVSTSRPDAHYHKQSTNIRSKSSLSKVYSLQELFKPQSSPVGYRSKYRGIIISSFLHNHILIAVEHLLLPVQTSLITSIVDCIRQSTL